MTPPAHHKTIAKHVRATWGGSPRVIVMRAEGTPHVQAIIETADFPERGLVSFSTVGLSDHGGAELTTAAPARYKSVIKALFDVASFVADGYRTVEADAVVEKALAHFYTRSEAAHWLVRTTGLERLTVPKLSVESQEIRWLHAWPITSDELIWYQGEGKTKLGPLLDRAGVSVFDLGRGSLEGVPVFDPWAVK